MGWKTKWLVRFKLTVDLQKVSSVVPSSFVHSLLDYKGKLPGSP
jgi:hypothetical protein